MRINRKDLIAILADEMGTSKAEAGRWIGMVEQSISDILRKGGSVSLAGFGTFAVRRRIARTSRNPRTGESVKVKARTVPAFRPGTALKGAVARTKVAGG